MRLSGLMRSEWWKGLLDVLRHGLPLPGDDIDMEIDAHQEAMRKYRTAMHRAVASNYDASLNARRTQELARSVLKRVERR